MLVAGDRDELLRVAENLIENAIKYGVRVDSDAAGVVDVAVSATEKEGVLTVRDYGHGIAPEHLPRLTERFYRVDPTQSRAKNGTGLGLAIVKHILTRHRGRLDDHEPRRPGILVRRHRAAASGAEALRTARGCELDFGPERIKRFARPDLAIAPAGPNLIG